MSRFTDPLEKLMEALRRLPGIGAKSAQRIAFHLLKADGAYIGALQESITDVREKVRLCAECHSYTDREVCEICADPARDHRLVCVVEKPFDIAAIEKSGRYTGTYHVLHGVLSPIDGIGPDQLRLGNLPDRIRRHEVTELIVATNPDVEGEATALYLARLVRPLGTLVSRIALGLPVGSELEFADDVTIARAMEGRTRL
ncbi:MAG: recombination protein RecR [Acidobacteria bacterium]|nr:recombination protein RecR [Acidobacteriota bacterium]